MGLYKAVAVSIATALMLGAIIAVATWEADPDEPSANDVRKAMTTLARFYPDDREAAIVYALALNMATPASDKSYAKRPRRPSWLLVALGQQPNHPRITHYLTYSGQLQGPVDRSREPQTCGTQGRPDCSSWS